MAGNAFLEHHRLTAPLLSTKGFIFYYDGPDVVHVKKSAGPEKFLCIGGGVRGSNLVILTYIWIERPCEASLFPGMSWVQNVVRQFGPPVKN